MSRDVVTLPNAVGVGGNLMLNTHTGMTNIRRSFLETLGLEGRNARQSRGAKAKWRGRLQSLLFLFVLNIITVVLVHSLVFT